ncbi:MAG: hypothetical protein Tsb0014_15970 [Pleurocapsa sp.]
MNKSDSDSLIIQQKDNLQNQLNKINYPVYNTDMRSIAPKDNVIDRPTVKQQKTIAYIYSEQALIYFREGNWQEAIAACQKALEISPEAAEAYKILGNILQRLGQKGKALGYYAKALEVKPDLAEVYANLGSYYAEQENWELAIEYYHQALAIKPNLAGIHRSLALIWEELGKTEKAVECLCQAITLEPKTLAPQDYFVFGNKLYEEKRYKEASVFYIQGIKLKPDAKEELARLVDILETIGEWQDAAEYYRQLINLQTNKAQTENLLVHNKPIKRLLGKIAKPLLSSTQTNNTPLLSQSPPRKSQHQLAVTKDRKQQLEAKQSTSIQTQNNHLKTQPESATSWNNLGSFYAKKQQWQKAISCYQEAIQLDSNFSKTYRNLARVYAKIGQSEKAADCWYEAFSLEPNNATSQDHYYLGKTLWQQEKIEKAIACFRRTIQLKPEFSDVYFSLGAIFKAQKHIEESKSCYLQAVKYDPHNFQGYFYLGQIATEQENWQQASDYYQKTVVLKPNFWEASYNLAETLSKQERWAEAANAYRQAISLKSDFSWAYHNLAYALQQQEKWSEAANAYRQAISLKSDFYWSYYNLGDTLSKLFQWDDAISCYQKAIELKPDAAEAYAHLGDALIRQEKCDIAIASYQKAIEINPGSNLEIYKNLGEALERQKKIKKLQQTMELASVAPKPQSSTENTSDSLVNVDRSAHKQNIQHQVSEPTNQNQVSKQDILFPDLDDESFVKYLYKTLLKRQADPQGLEGNLNALKHNVPRRIILENILNTEEFLTKNNQLILEELSNSQFLQVIWELLLGRGCDSHAEKAYLANLENGLTRIQAICEITKSDEFKERIKNLELLAENRSRNSGSVWIMGTEKFLTHAEWEQKLLKVLCQQSRQKNKSSELNLTTWETDCESPAIKKYLSSNNEPLVSVITSLYKGRDFIEYFLENITTQTIFHTAELIIVDANSPENEFDIIEKYLTKFDNIKYIRTERVVGIYEAWNIGIKVSQGKFLTNANLDDLRRQDCLEKQAEFLLNNEDVDLVYQDFYYSLTDNLPFEIIEKCNYKSQLPKVATKDNMLQFNSPHNGPMWRRNLHDRVGLFNTSYKSGGDYELWMRALLTNAKFMKVSEPIAVYYNNPKGISTRSESHGSYEAKEIQTIYKNLFKGNFLSITPEEFIKISRSLLGLTGDINEIQNSQEAWQNKITFLDKCFEIKLKELTKNKFYIPLND